MLILVGVAAYTVVSQSIFNANHGKKSGINNDKVPLDYIVRSNVVDVLIHLPSTDRRNDTAKVSWRRPVCSRSSETGRIICAKISSNISTIYRM